MQFTSSKRFALALLAAFIFFPGSLLAQWSNLSLTLLPSPCRVLDTRLEGGTIQINEVLVFSVEEGFSELQGGSDDCFIPTNAAAVKLIVKGQSISYDGGYFRVFNASASIVGPYSSLQLQDPGQFVGDELDVPVDGNLLVAIHTIVEANAVVDISGYYLPGS